MRRFGVQLFSAPRSLQLNKRCQELTVEEPFSLRLHGVSLVLPVDEEHCQDEHCTNFDVEHVWSESPPKAEHLVPSKCPVETLLNKGEEVKDDVIRNPLRSHKLLSKETRRS